MTAKNITKCWVTWERQPRNISMARFLDCDYYEFSTQKKGAARYLYCIRETYKVFSKRYDQVFVQNPSIILSFFAVVFKVIFNYTVIIDAHNAGVRPKEGRNRVLQSFNRFILKRADIVIVTNKTLEAYLGSYNIETISIPDPLPELPLDSDYILKDNQIFIICSWAEDEPIQLYLDAASELSNYTFIFSGNYKKHFGSENSCSLSNVVLPGFVSESDYKMFLATSALIVDLTLREDCLVCGAYEAVSLNKSVVLTDNLINKDLFGGAAFYSKIDLEDFIDTIKKGLNYNITEDIYKFKEKYERALFNKKLELSEKLKKVS